MIDTYDMPKNLSLKVSDLIHNMIKINPCLRSKPIDLLTKSPFFNSNLESLTKANDQKA
jgi:hypothetical protein